MSNILRRPMFRRGGPINSRGTGLTSGLAPKRGIIKDIVQTNIAREIVGELMVKPINNHSAITEQKNLENLMEEELLINLELGEKNNAYT